MDAVMWASLTIAALGVFVSTRMYRHGYNYPRLEGNLSEVKKSFIGLLGWLGLLALAIIVWASIVIPHAPLSGMPMLLVVIASLTGVVAPLAGLVIGTKHGRRKLTRS